MVLAGLQSVDAVVVIDQDTLHDVLPKAIHRQLRPDVDVKGGDYALAALPKRALGESWGGEVCWCRIAKDDRRREPGVTITPRMCLTRYATPGGFS